MRTGTLTERFWAKVEPEPMSGCWLWTAGVSLGGYGRFHLGIDAGTRAVQAHRVAYELVVGPIPDGHQLDHLCRVRSCVNPDHLEPVTNRENVLRGTGTSAVNAAKTHCVHGHEFTPENTHVTSRGFRDCRACYRRKNQARA